MVYLRGTGEEALDRAPELLHSRLRSFVRPGPEMVVIPRGEIVALADDAQALAAMLTEAREAPRCECEGYPGIAHDLLEAQTRAGRAEAAASVLREALRLIAEPTTQPYARQIARIALGLEP